jgi:phosphoribosylformimino-5-aminoimidazole carboxamide ribotide isomerase
MQLIPAIDLLDGRCVRLRHGDFEQVTFYDFEPAEKAREYHEQGAEWLHVVDLAASRDGADANTAPLFELLSVAPQKVQTGGGVREAADVEARLEAGASRVVVGSVCAQDPERFGRWLERFGPDQLVAALDVRFDRSGIPYPAIHGWTETAARDLYDLLDELSSRGLKHVLCTDISRDGDMSGPNGLLYQLLVARYPRLQLQASGGVSSLEDLLMARASGAAGVITGKALLDGVFTVEQALLYLEVSPWEAPVE